MKNYMIKLQLRVISVLIVAGSVFASRPIYATDYYVKHQDNPAQASLFRNEIKIDEQFFPQYERNQGLYSTCYGFASYHIFQTLKNWYHHAQEAKAEELENEAIARVGEENKNLGFFRFAIPARPPRVPV